MESDTSWYADKQGEKPAVIDMADEETSDYEDFQGQTEPRQRSNPDDGVKTVREDFSKNVTSFMWQAGKAQAQQALTSYARIDILRPYFDVEPHEVLNRLVCSMIPKFPGSRIEKLPSELYGPTMLVFTLVALLLFQMKMSGHHVGEGTLMGSAIGLCFAYWIGGSALIWSVAYVSNAHIRGMQIASLLGYALTGHCIVIFLGTAVHTTHSHLFFYFLWAVVGGLCTLKMVTVLIDRIPGKTQRVVMCAIVVTLHLLFLLYLHFAYHQVVEDLSEILKDSPIKDIKARHPISNDKAINTVGAVIENGVRTLNKLNA